MEVPEVRYAKSADLHIAYQVNGERTVRPRLHARLCDVKGVGEEWHLYSVERDR